MRVVTGIVAALGLGVLVFLGIGFWANSEVSVRQHIAFDELKVLEQSRVVVSDLAHWDAWSPWKASDPSMKTILGSTTTGVGGTMQWTSAQSPHGKVIITHSDTSALRYDLSFSGMDTSPGYFEFITEPTPQLVWGFQSDLGKPFGFLLKPLFEEEITKQYQQGLARIKALASSALQHSEPTDVAAP